MLFADRDAGALFAVQAYGAPTRPSSAASAATSKPSSVAAAAAVPERRWIVAERVAGGGGGGGVGSADGESLSEAQFGQPLGLALGSGFVSGSGCSSESVVYVADAARPVFGV